MRRGRPSELAVEEEWEVEEKRVEEKTAEEEEWEVEEKREEEKQWRRRTHREYRRS